MQIKLEKVVRASDLLELNYISKDQCSIELLADASIASFDEGLIVAIFDGISRDFKEFNITISFEPSETQHEIYFSLLGLNLLNNASALTVKQLKGRFPDSKERERAIESLWGKIISNNGVIESGHHRYFISRDPTYPLPQILSPSLNGKFPSIEAFTDLIATSIKSMIGASNTLDERHYESIGSFVYESAKNAHEHGRQDIDGKVIPGYRGVILERMRVGNDGFVRSNHGLALNMEKYMDSFGGWARGKHFIGISVVDLGQGIHKTIPRISDESDIDLLQRAFEPGVTRKPPSEIGTGLGFTNMLRAVKQCDGFLSIHSAGFLTSTWYSEIPINLDAQRKFFSDIKELKTNRGTTLTFVFPVERSRHS